MRREIAGLFGKKSRPPASETRPPAARKDCLSPFMPAAAQQPIHPRFNLKNRASSTHPAKDVKRQLNSE
jgi:hypothetical protein